MIAEKISIIMGVYNAEHTLREAIESILKQTYNNWEFIICDDNSNDATPDILDEYAAKYPNKFLILKNIENFGLAYSLNKCLKYAKGKYIARMDADDISASDRFENQLLFLKENPQIDLVGTSMQRFDSLGLKDILIAVSNPNKYTLRRKIPFNHATIMTYKTVYDTLGGYTVSTRTKRSQDYDLWFRFYHNGFNGENLKHPYYFVREDKNAIRRRTIKVRFNALKTTIIGYKLLGYPKKWLLRPVFMFLFKSLTPFYIIDLFRKIQNNRSQS